MRYIFSGNYEEGEEERDDGQVEDPYGGGGGDSDGAEDGYTYGARGSSEVSENSYTYGRGRDPCEGIDCPPIYWDGFPIIVQ